MFFRLFQHLLPRGEAWKIRDVPNGGTQLSQFFRGLANALEPIRAFFDGIWSEAMPATTTHLAEWEAQYGLEPNADEATRRLNLAAEWAATGGQGKDYIEGVLQTAGFAVNLHEWWAPGPFVARDPRVYTVQPLIGSYQCTPTSAPAADQVCCAPGVIGQPQCNRFLQNDTHYIVNLALTDEAPPPVPDAPEYWPYFFYVGGASFPDTAAVDPARRAEFERLLLKLRPQQQWIVTLIEYA